MLLLVAGSVATEAEGLAAVATREGLEALMGARVVLHVANLLEDASADSARIYAVETPRSFISHLLDVVILVGFPDRTFLIKAAYC